VLLNLLLNAGDALAGHAAPCVRIVGVQREGSVELLVSDNGPGLSDAARAHLFEPFFTTKPPGKGTGLGLALSREYMESFKGTLSYEDAPGGGACFRLTFPTAAEER
jgi:C4-dicarboxylate-specific signal transduction histidine kinase